MSKIIRTHVSDKAEQFTIGDDHYVGRRVLEHGGNWEVETFAENEAGEVHRLILVRLDYAKGDIFVDPAMLRPFPDEPIPEPSK